MIKLNFSNALPLFVALRRLMPSENAPNILAVSLTSPALQRVFRTQYGLHKVHQHISCDESIVSSELE